MLIEKGCADTGLRVLSEEMFSRSDLAFVFRGIKQTMERLHTCDFLLVTQELMHMDSALASALGVPHLVTSLVAKVCSGANFSFHIAVMKEKYMMREFILKSSALTASAYDPETSPEDLVAEMQKLCGFMMEQLYAEERTLSMKDVVDRTFDLYYDKAKRSEAGGIPGVTSGVADLDTVLGGWGKSTLNIIAARPGMGKTAFMLFAALAAARDNRTAAILSLEMDATQLGGRILQGQSGVNDKSFRLGMLDEVGIQLMEDTADNLIKLPLYINDNPMQNMAQIRNLALKLKNTIKLDILFIDYLQLIDMRSKNGNYNREQEVSATSRLLKILAKELEIPIVVLSQLNRSNERRDSKRPQLHDLRDSGAIEQDADTVLFLHRPYYYSRSEADRGEMIIDLVKHRNGETKEITVMHNETFSEFAGERQ